MCLGLSVLKGYSAGTPSELPIQAKRVENVGDITKSVVEGCQGLEGLSYSRILPDDLHAHPDGGVGVASDEPQVGFTHETLQQN